jgi:hypothetical protein
MTYGDVITTLLHQPDDAVILRVDRADPDALICVGLLDEAGLERLRLGEGDTVTFGTPGWGVGEVTYRLAGWHDANTRVMVRVDDGPLSVPVEDPPSLAPGEGLARLRAVADAVNPPTSEVDVLLRDAYELINVAAGAADHLPFTWPVDAETWQDNYHTHLLATTEEVTIVATVE